MKARDIPPMQTALADLSPHFSTFYDAFESGTDHGKGYFEKYGFPFNPWLHANLVRNWVKNILDKHDLKTQFESEELANSGLQLSINQWFVRIRKSLHGEVPSPGRSKALQAYYRQYRQLLLPEEFSVMHNLLLLWHATSKGDFQGLSLVYPLSADMMRWRAEIPHPAQSTNILTTYQAAFDELGDLEIEPLDEGDEDIEAEGQ